MVSRAGVYGWYEIHSVVRSVLRNDLRDPERTTVARRRAATWLEGRGGDAGGTRTVVARGRARRSPAAARSAPRRALRRGQETTTSATSWPISRPGPRTDLSTLLDLGWCQLMTSRAAFLDCVDQADWWASNRGISDGPLTSKLDTMKSISCLIRGDWSMASELARRRVSPLDLWPDDPVGRTGWSNVGRAIALSERWDDSVDELRELAVTHAASRAGAWSWRPPGHSARHWPDAPATRCGSQPTFGRRRCSATSRSRELRLRSPKQSPTGRWPTRRASPISSPSSWSSRSSR